MSDYSHKDYKNDEYKYYITLSWKFAAKYMEYSQIKTDYEKLKKELYNIYINKYMNYREDAMVIAYYNVNNNIDIINKKKEVEKIKREYIILDDEYYYLYNKFNLSQI
tara:strand:+ start:200 stop:523 length:324 start_codon:yes stop_codon:yes gene_type:complete